MTDTFTLDWPHGLMLNDGRPARIICTDAKGEHPIIALVNFGPYDLVLWFSADGRVASSLRLGKHNLRLVNAPAPKLSGTVWVNVREHDEYVGVGHAYVSREMADRVGDDDDRLACVEVHWTEGEGL